MPQSRSRRGLTLLELLIVVALLSLASAAVLALRPGERVRTIEDALAEFIELEQFARLAAERSGPVVMRFEAGSFSATDFERDEPMRSLPLGTTGAGMLRGCSIQATDADFTPLERVTIDRRGASVDYRVMIDCDGERLLATVYGASGWVEVTP